MRTTLSLDETLYREIKATAALQGCTVGSVVEDALRSYLQRNKVQVDLPPLTTSPGCRLAADVDLDDFSSVLDLLDEETPLDVRR